MEYSSPNNKGGITLIFTAQYQQATPMRCYIFSISYGPIGPNGILNQNVCMQCNTSGSINPNVKLTISPLYLFKICMQCNTSGSIDPNVTLTISRAGPAHSPVRHWLEKSASDEFSGGDTNQLSTHAPAGVP